MMSLEGTFNMPGDAQGGGDKPGNPIEDTYAAV